MTKLPFNKGEPSKLPEPKIHLAIRNSLPIKNGTLIEAFSCFAGSNNDLSCYLACKILFNALLRLVNWQIHLPKPVYLSWVFCCLHAFITRQFEHVFRTNQMAPARNQSRQRGKSHAHGKLFFIETCEESYNGNVWSVKTAWMSFKRVLISNETKNPKRLGSLLILVCYFPRPPQPIDLLDTVPPFHFTRSYKEREQRFSGFFSGKYMAHTVSAFSEKVTMMNC